MLLKVIGARVTHTSEDGGRPKLVERLSDCPVQPPAARRSALEPEGHARRVEVVDLAGRRAGLVVELVHIVGHVGHEFEGAIHRVLRGVASVMGGEKLPHLIGSLLPDSLSFVKGEWCV